MKWLKTDTAKGYAIIHQHQAVLVLTNTPGKVHKGAILTPGEKKSYVRYNEDGILQEKKIDNKKLYPVKLKQAAPKNLPPLPKSVSDTTVPTTPAA